MYGKFRILLDKKDSMGYIRVLCVGVYVSACMEGYRSAWKMSKNSDTQNRVVQKYENPFVSAYRHRETDPMRSVDGWQHGA